MPRPPADAYFLALTPVDPGMPSVVARIELDAGHARTVEISVRPGSAGSPLPAELGDIDLPFLIQNAALMSAGRLPTGTPEGVASMAPQADAEVRDKPEVTAAPAPVPAPRAARSGRRRPDRDQGLNGMPSDLPKTYWRLGSVAKLAEHYDVPRQIAQGWIKALRAGGALPDPWASRPRGTK